MHAPPAWVGGSSRICHAIFVQVCRGFAMHPQAVWYSHMPERMFAYRPHPTLQVVRYSHMLQRLHAYRPELPSELLAQAVGLQGDTGRLERVINSMIRGVGRRGGGGGGRGGVGRREGGGGQGASDCWGR